MLRATDPPPGAIVGSFNALMLYDYYDLGQAVWETQHIYVEELTPQAFDSALTGHGKLYLLGRYGRRYTREQGVDLDSYTLEPLDGDHDMLWVVHPTGMGD
jgi:hypothetical protein